MWTDLIKIILIYLFSSVTGTNNEGRRKNILFLAVDDLRPELKPFIDPENPRQMFPRIHTPHIDALAARSLVARQAFVQMALCTPSRASIMTGRRPHTTKVYALETYFREVGGNFTTIPQYFKNYGYVTVGMGKMFHAGPTCHNDRPSWTEAYYRPPYNWMSKEESWKAVPLEDHMDEPLPDESIATHAIETMDDLAPAAKAGEKPFFLGIGFLKPHLPFVFPEEYLDLYPLESVGLPSNPYSPRAMPLVAWSTWGEMRSYSDIGSIVDSGVMNVTLPEHVTRDLRRAYYASVSYIDAQVGRVLRKLEELDLIEDTIIAVWGDHGFMLGEHGAWAKHCNFELATRAPLMIAVPGLTDAGYVSDKLVEFVDLFPTLAEAAGLPEVEVCPEDSALVATCTEGSSLVPLMTDAPEQVLWKDRVFSQYPRRWHQTPLRYMGYSMRTQHYRYTEWVGFNAQTNHPDWSDVFARELYDHQKDPEENANRANWPKYAEVREVLSRQLREGWRSAIP